MPATPNAADTDLLAPLPPPLRDLARRGEIKRYRKGQVLIQEGEYGDTLFVILSGRVRAYGSSERGREITYGTFGPGEYLGEVSLDGGPRSASVITLEACECAVVTRRSLLQHIADHPEFALQLLDKLIQRVRVVTLNAKRLALNDVYERLVLLLDALAVRQEDGTRTIALRPTHQDMADRIGCSREMVSRLMKDLERGGYVAASGVALTIARPLPAEW